MRRETKLSELTVFRYGQDTPIRKTKIDRLLEKTAWEIARLRTVFKIAEEEDHVMLVRPGPKAFTPEELAEYFRKVACLDWVIFYPPPDPSSHNYVAENENYG